MYTKELDSLRAKVLNYDLPLGVRLDAFSIWCALWDKKEAQEEAARDAASEHAL